MPLAGMTNPPMQWGYPRTVEGFIHAFTRGQYEKTNPTDIIGDPMRFIGQQSVQIIDARDRHAAGPDEHVTRRESGARRWTSWLDAREQDRARTSGDRQASQVRRTSG